MAEPLDVVELLIQDHRMMGQLLQELDEQEQPDSLRLLYLRLVGLLSAHEEAEQEVVFPAFRSAFPAAGHEAANRLAEHEEVNELLAEMRGLTPAGPGFEKRASALILELQNHLLNEEESVFPMLQAAVSHDQLLELAGRVEAVKRRARLFPSLSRRQESTVESAAEGQDRVGARGALIDLSVQALGKQCSHRFSAGKVRSTRA